MVLSYLSSSGTDLVFQQHIWWHEEEFNHFEITYIFCVVFVYAYM